VYGAAGVLPLLVLAALAWFFTVSAVRARVERDAERRAAGFAERLGMLTDYHCRRAVEWASACAHCWDMYPVEASLGSPLCSKAAAVRRDIDATSAVRRAIILDASGTPRYRVERSGIEGEPPRAVVRVETQHFSASDRDGAALARSLEAGQCKALGWRVDSTGMVRRLAARPTGARDGYVLVDLSLSALIDTLASKWGEPVVLGERGTLLWHPEPAKRRQAATLVEPTLARVAASLPSGSVGATSATVGGVLGAVGYRSEPGSGWTVLMVSPYAPALTPLRRVAGWAVAALVAAIASGAFVLLGFARRFAGTVQRLVAGARAFARGDLVHRVPGNSGDELGRLGTALNLMADDLCASHDRLREQERLALMGELSAALAHEVRNPLHSMAVSAETARRTTSDPAIREECLQLIEDEAHRLNHVLTRFLELGRPLPLNKQPTDLRDLMRRASSVALSGRHNGRIEVVEEFPDPCPDVEVDEAQILQALLNVSLNAVEAMPEGGTLRLHLGPANGTVVVAVSDSGHGIDPAVRSRVFEPFVSGKPRGCGLGLAVVKRVIEAHGGMVTIDGVGDRGTKVMIVLPTGKEHGQSQDPPGRG